MSTLASDVAASGTRQSVRKVRGNRGNPGSRGNRGSRRTATRSSLWWPVLFIGPMFIGLSTFYLWPALRTLYLSFTRSGAFGGSSFVGLENYAKLLSNPELGQAMLNTGIYTALSLLGIPLALIVAALLNTTDLRGRGVYRVLYFLPVVTMPAAVSIVWRMIYSGDYGVLNQLLRLVGINGRSWLTDPTTALVAIAVVGIWAGLGSHIVIFLAGLQGVPRELTEAAEIDGAGPIRRFLHVTLPMISPAVFFVSVITVIGSLQVFDLVFVMMGLNNPAMPHVKTIVYLFYEAGFMKSDPGSAAAIAFILLLIILVLTVVQFAMQRRWVHYD